MKSNKFRVEIDLMFNRSSYCYTPPENLEPDYTLAEIDAFMKEPLYLDIRDLFYGKEKAPVVIGGRYGLSSKDTTPSMIISVYDNMKMKEPKNRFTLGIVDDVTFLSLPLKPEISVSKKGTYEAKFYGIGSDGTVGANKNSIKIFYV
jgi:hypothetical protein